MNGESSRRFETFTVLAGIFTVVVVAAIFVAAARSSQNAVADASYRETIEFHCVR